MQHLGSHGPQLSGHVSDITFRLYLMVPYDIRGPALNPACNAGPPTRAQDPTLTHALKSEYPMVTCISCGIRSLVRFRCLRRVWKCEVYAIHTCFGILPAECGPGGLCSHGSNSGVVAIKIPTGYAVGCRGIYIYIYVNKLQ